MDHLNPRPLAVRFDESRFWIDLDDGRILAVPLAWFPRLTNATPAQLLDVQLSPRGLHWNALDEDISVAGLLAGKGDKTKALSPTRTLD